MDLRNLLTISEAITRSALDREESRGAHFRTDHEDKSEKWAKLNIVVRKGDDGGMHVEHVPVQEMTDEHKAIVEEMK